MKPKIHLFRKGEKITCTDDFRGTVVQNVVQKCTVFRMVILRIFEIVSLESIFKLPDRAGFQFFKSHVAHCLYLGQLNLL